MNQDELKRLVGQAALAQVPEGAVIGVGTGSTVDCFIDALAASGRRIAGAVSSSSRSTARLQSHGIRVREANEVESLPVYIDGADEVTEHLHMIKGGGGALTREKIVASVADRFICIADESKLVDVMGKFPLPIEVIPMAREAVARAMTAMGGQPRLREGFVTDNGNIILDVSGLSITDATGLEARINNLPGVVTCGLFAIAGADVALLATQNGIRRLDRRA